MKVFVWTIVIVVAVVTFLALSTAGADESSTRGLYLYAYRDTDQPIPNRKWTVVQFTKGNSQWSGAYSITTPEFDRVYDLSVNLAFRAKSGGSRHVRIQENNGRTGWKERAFDSGQGWSNAKTRLSASGQFSVDGNDVVRVEVYQNSGSTAYLCGSPRARFALDDIGSQY